MATRIKPALRKIRWEEESKPSRFRDILSITNPQRSAWHYLEGTINGTHFFMRLRSPPDFPITDPYSDALFNRIKLEN